MRPVVTTMRLRRVSEALLLPVAGLALMAGGCSTTGCLNNQNSLPLAGFYSAADGSAVSVSNLTVRGAGAPNDSALLAPERTASTVYLPFRPARQSAQFLFQCGDFADVVTFNYESVPYFASEECGAMWEYKITEVTCDGSLYVAKVEITDSLVTNLEKERIRIYLNAIPEPEPEEPDAPENTPDTE